MIDARHTGNQIRYQLEEWGAIPEEEWDAYMNLQLSHPTGVQILGKESRIVILETADLGEITEFQSLLFHDSFSMQARNIRTCLCR